MGLDFFNEVCTGLQRALYPVHSVQQALLAYLYIPELGGIRVALEAVLACLVGVVVIWVLTPLNPVLTLFTYNIFDTYVSISYMFTCILARCKVSKID